MPIDGQENTFYIPDKLSFVKNAVAIEYYVTTGGSDNGSGSIGDPFATIQHAIDKVSAVTNRTVNINVGAGTFAETLDISKLGRISTSYKINIKGTYTELLGDTIASSDTSTSVTVSGASWTPDEFKGKIFLITSGTGYLGVDYDYLQMIRIKSNTSDTLNFEYVSMSIDGTTHFKIVEPATTLNSAGNSTGVAINSGKTCSVEIDYFIFDGATSFDVSHSSGSAIFVGCNNSNACNIGYYASSPLSIYGGYMSEDYGTGIYASGNNSCRIISSYFENIDATGKRVIRSVAGSITSVKYSYFNNCYEGCVCDQASVVDYEKSSIDNCVRALRVSSSGYIEAYDLSGSGNTTVVFATSGGRVWYNSTKITGTTQLSISGDTTVYDNDTGVTYLDSKLNLQGYQILDDDEFVDLQARHAVYSDTTTQTSTSTTVPWAMTFDTIEHEHGITLGLTGTVTISNATPAVISWEAHGLFVDSPVVFTTTGALPTGLTAGTKYYVISTGYGADSFQVSATPQGAAVNTSDDGSGVHTATNTSIIKVGGDGFYGFIFSSICDCTSGNATTMDIWFRNCGVNITRSNTRVRIATAGNEMINIADVAVDLSADDCIEMFWASSSTNDRLLAIAEQSNPTRPATPSTILTIKRISKEIT